MSKLFVLSVVAALLTGCVSVVDQAVQDETRLPEAIERDTARKPGDVMTFAGVGSGDRIVEFAPAGGYYTALLSRAVGETGHVYAVDPERIFEYFPNGRKGFPAYIEKDPRANVTYSIQKLDALDVPGPLDQAWMVLYYHDTIWTKEDRQEMNKRIFHALEPGGVFLVLDHHALAGAPDSVTRDLHRVDAALVQREIEAAGFVLDATSDLLANPDDPRNDSVFGEDRRGNTDRFLWRFKKP